MKSLMLIVGVMFCFGVSTAPLFADDVAKLYVRGKESEKVVFYDKINGEKPIGNFYGGYVVNCIGAENDWSKLMLEGWLKYKHVENQENDLFKAIKGVFVLDKPGFLGLHVGYLESGNIVKRIEDKKSEWLKIHKEVWIKSKLLSDMPTRPIEMVSWEWTKPTNSIMINGIVKNNTDITHNFLKIIIKAKDSNGNDLGTGDGFVNRKEFKPGESSSFTVIIDGAQPETDKINIQYEWESIETENEKKR